MPSFMAQVGILKFDTEKLIHQKLAENSKRCHQLKSEGEEGKIENLENEINYLTKKLFGV